jgi:hypothetical protein
MPANNQTDIQPFRRSLAHENPFRLASDPPARERFRAAVDLALRHFTEAELDSISWRVELLMLSLQKTGELGDR